MSVLVIADLHLDMWLGAQRDPLAAIGADVWASLDALIIAGDLCNMCNRPKRKRDFEADLGASSGADMCPAS